MKKCDIKGCKAKAEIFTKNRGFCRDHWRQITNEYFERGLEIAKKRGFL